MSFAEDTRSYSDTAKRTSASYLKFTPEYKVVIRVLNPEAKRVFKHWIQAANGGKGAMVVCPNITAQTNVCPICPPRKLEKDDPRIQDRAKKRFVVNVLDRTPYTTCTACNNETPSASGKKCINCGADVRKLDFKPLNKVKIMEGGPRLFIEELTGIEKSMKEDIEDTDITSYDISLVTSGTGRERKIKGVPMLPPEPLSETALLDDTGEAQKLFDLDLLSEPASIEEIKMMLAGATFEEINQAKGIE